MCYSDGDDDGNTEGYRECVIGTVMVTGILTVTVNVL